MHIVIMALKCPAFGDRYEEPAALLAPLALLALYRVCLEANPQVLGARPLNVLCPRQTQSSY